MPVIEKKRGKAAADEQTPISSKLEQRYAFQLEEPLLLT